MSSFPLLPNTSTRSAMPSENSQRASSVEGTENQIRLRSICLSPFGRTLFSSVLLWLAFPPVGFSWLAWFSLIPMLSLVLVTEDDFSTVAHVRPRLLGRPMIQVWLASLIFWLVTFYFIPLPHPILIIGWIALSAYLAVYTPLLLVVARTLVWQWKVSPLVAVPIAWTGLEWIRVNFLTGFGMAALSHSQYSNPLVIQIADISGAYTVTFAITAFATAAMFCCYSMKRVQGVIGCGVIAALVIGYGTIRLNQVNEPDTTVTKTVALVQTSIDTILKQKTEAQLLSELSHLRDINWAARQAHDSIDLIIWPESSYPYGNHVSEDDSNKRVMESVLISQSNLKGAWHAMANGSGRFSVVPIIAGTSTIDLDRQQVFNSAILLDDTGRAMQRYDKNHRVMFGEYVPLIEHFPTLMRHLPVNTTNLTPGTQAKLFEAGGLKIVPNVCFESTVPHLIRRQLNTISDAVGEPDVLLNITNDGWFFGSSCLDLHYACNVFRAVELRKPMLVCANTGLSGHIDPWGIAIKKGKRRKAEFLICDVDTDRDFPGSLYRTIGDVIPMLLGAICIVALITRLRRW